MYQTTYDAKLAELTTRSTAAQRRREAQRGPGGVHSYDDGLLGEGGNGNGIVIPLVLTDELTITLP